jgi:hypothetical protein
MSNSDWQVVGKVQYERRRHHIKNSREREREADIWRGCVGKGYLIRCTCLSAISSAAVGGEEQPSMRDWEKACSLSFSVPTPALRLVQGKELFGDLNEGGR